MKATTALLLAAAADATVIRLSPDTPAFKLATSIVRPHDLGAVQPDGTAVSSRQDYTERCPVNTATHLTNHENCPFPKARGYDHHDQEVSVTTRVFLVNEDGVDKNEQVNGGVDFDKRSVYLFKYDAEDTAGNHAEQVVFGLILDDIVAPVIQMCGSVAENWEAATGRELCSASTVSDNYDTLTAADIKYTIQHMRTSTELCTKVDYATAKDKITGDLTGRFLVTLSAEDAAGTYGANGVNNCATEAKAVLVQDTTIPTLCINGAQPTQTHECSFSGQTPYIAFVDDGATPTDSLDTVALGLTMHVTARSDVVENKVGDYTIEYDVNDKAGNDAVTVTRNVQVRDTTDPVLTLTCTGVCDIVHYAGDTFDDPGSTCTDTCDQNLAETSTAWDTTFDDTTVGVYTRTYTCCDAANAGQAAHCVTQERKFTVQDQTAPIIHIVGEGHITVEATHDASYTDQGATCTDYVDGPIDGSVQTSGHTVSYIVPGNYVIRYDCQDAHQNPAVPVMRTVYIKDRTCPSVVLEGNAVQMIEAGFPYVDAGATATDDLDGTLTQCAGNSPGNCWSTDGDTVNTAKSFYARRSCRHIQSTCSTCQTGEYFITTYTASRHEYNRVNVWCDMQSSTGFTYKPVALGTAVTAAYSTHQGDCPKYGMEMADFTGATAAQARAEAKFGASYFVNGGTNYYLCAINDGGVAYSELPKLQTVGHEDIAHAEEGEYHINFHVSDLASNTECVTPVRTVVVKDTLPPVITLHLKNTLIHTSKTTDLGVGGEANPAGMASYDGSESNPTLVSGYVPSAAAAPNTFPQVNNLMAEESQSSVSGWIVAAAASGVTGLALVAYASK